MQVLKVTNAVTFYVETDNPDFDGYFRRGETGGWEQRMGESWEPVYDDQEIEAAFQAFNKPVP